jgi:hypothetical protein
MGVHNAASNLFDLPLGMNILQQCYGISRGYRFSPKQITQNEINKLESRIARLMPELWSSYYTINETIRSPITTSERLQQTCITRVISELRIYGWSSTIHKFNNITVYDLFDLVLTFIEAHIKTGYPSYNVFAARWAIDWIESVIEAYSDDSNGSTLANFTGTQRISCTGGIIERLLLSISNVLTECRNTVMPEEFKNLSNAGERTKMLRSWLQEFYNQPQNDPNYTVAGHLPELRQYILEKISQQNPPLNNLATWGSEIDDYVNGPEPSLLGGRKNRKTRNRKTKNRKTKNRKTKNRKTKNRKTKNRKTRK